MSYLNVEGIYKKLLEDSHTRPVQRNKVMSSNIRNDRVPGSKKVNPKVLGIYTTEEDMLEAVFRAGTINQNNEYLRLNRIAIKRGLEWAKHNPKMIPKIAMDEPSSYTVYRKVKDKLDPDSGKRVPYSDPPKTQLGSNDNDFTARAFPNQHNIALNANSPSVQAFIVSQTESLRRILTILIEHEKSHIIFIDWVDRKFGHKMKRELAIKSQTASDNLIRATKYYELVSKTRDKNDPIVKEAKEILDYNQKYYDSDPLEMVAKLIEEDMKTHDDNNAIPRNINLIHRILEYGINEIKAGRR